MFKEKIWNIDYPDLRIKFGFHLRYLGKSFVLQKKVKFLFFNYWKTISWTYPVDGNNELNENIKGYLVWKYEKGLNS